MSCSRKQSWTKKRVGQLTLRWMWRSHWRNDTTRMHCCRRPDSQRQGKDASGVQWMVKWGRRWLLSGMKAKLWQCNLISFSGVVIENKYMYLVKCCSQTDA
jgi:hypothetical protein